jgi:hypothetical protein
MEDMKCLAQDYIGKNVSVSIKLSQVWKCLEKEKWGLLWWFKNRCQYSKVHKTLKRLLLPAKKIKNDSELSKQIDEAQDMLARIKTNNE